MIGISRKIMIHGETFFSNQQQQFQFKGASFYAKYRLFSIDDVHSHFRMAVFGRVASNNSPMHSTAIVLNGSTAGVESGLVATKLLNKVAMSSSFSFVHSFTSPSLNSPNEIHNHLLLPNQKNAVNYTLSIGKLMLPKHYVNYNQVNVNGIPRLPKLVSDGALVCTAAGSTAYARSMGASPLLADTPAWLLVGSNVMEPAHWKSALLSVDSTIEIISIGEDARPVVAYVDGVPQGEVRSIKARLSRAATAELVFLANHDMAEKIAAIQFAMTDAKNL
jgi:hypothetical protein